MTPSSCSTQKSRSLKRRVISSGDPLVQGFLEGCLAAGYAEITIYGQRTILHAFLRWANGAEFATMDLGEPHLDSYLAGKPDSKPIVSVQAPLRGA